MLSWRASVHPSGLARIMITWGAISALMVLTTGEWSFYVLRFLLGAAEAGSFPGIAYRLAQWLSPRDRTAALASIATMSMVSGVVGGPLAAALWRLMARSALPVGSGFLSSKASLR
jgi:MFS transporter, ACS family, tartrate transporter